MAWLAVRRISVGFSSSTKFLPIFCWVIKIFQGTSFSHVYVKNSTKYGIDLIYQASGHAVNFMSSEVFWTKNETVREFEFDISDESFDKYMKFALSNVGKPYSVVGVIGLFVMRLLNLSKNPFDDGRSSFVCSEAVADVLSEASLLQYSRDQIAAALPLDVYNVCLGLEIKNKAA